MLDYEGRLGGHQIFFFCLESQQSPNHFDVGLQRETSGYHIVLMVDYKG
jgi:hypothetical protein